MAGRTAIAASFVAGLVLGGLGTSHVWIQAAKRSGEAARTRFLVEQELLGERATRAGDSFRGAVHFLNVADAQAGVGFRWLERENGTTYWEWLGSPWLDFLPLAEQEREMRAPRIEQGHRGVEAIYWGRAAAALERFGRPDLAKGPYAAATALDPKRSIEWYREYARLSGHGTEQLERAYLDSRSFDEMAAVLGEGRRRLEESGSSD
jgi:hypothetical protein